MTKSELQDYISRITMRYIFNNVCVKLNDIEHLPSSITFDFSRLQNFTIDIPTPVHGSGISISVFDVILNNKDRIQQELIDLANTQMEKRLRLTKSAQEILTAFEKEGLIASWEDNNAKR